MEKRYNGISLVKRVSQKLVILGIVIMYCTKSCKKKHILFCGKTESKKGDSKQTKTLCEDEHQYFLSL